MSLKAKLGIGAGVIGLVALLTAGLMIVAINRLADQIDATLAAERRLDRYAVLSTQATSFIVVAAEAVQSGLDPAERIDRVGRVSDNLQATFAKIRSDLEAAVADAERLGFDEQSRRATQSLAIARMEAHLEQTRTALDDPDASRERLQGFIDSFALGLDPLLNSVITEEARARETIIKGIERLKRGIILAALAAGLATLLLFAGFYLGLVRPQFRRLDLLGDAARQIGREDFTVALPDAQSDEIGQLFSETNRMAAALATRRDRIDAEWVGLNDTIAQRTDALRAANAQLAKTDENRRRFFADLSHELRTPLTVILMEAELGERGAPEPEGAFNKIRARAMGLNRKIDDLLRLARSETGEIGLVAETFDLSEAAREAVDETSTDTGSAGVVVDHVPDAPVPAFGDKNWVRQVLAGLILNVTRHAGAGGRLGLKTETKDDMAMAHVIDNGPGIPDAAQAKIFERFSQGATPARSEGFGIGLSLAKWIVEKQGGKILVTSPVPDGLRLGDEPGTMVSVGIPVRSD